jgi:hypothetical protein
MMRLPFPLGVPVAVIQAEIFAILARACDCIERNYTGEQIYICSDMQAAL